MNKKLLIVICLCVLIAIGVFFALKIFGKNDFKISLYDNASTGNAWYFKMSEQGIVEVTSDTDYSKCDKNVVGCGGERIYTIKPLKAGNVTLTFEWLSPENKIVKTAIYNLEISNDLKIKESHSGSYFK